MGVFDNADSILVLIPLRNSEQLFDNESVQYNDIQFLKHHRNDSSGHGGKIQTLLEMEDGVIVVSMDIEAEGIPLSFPFFQSPEEFVPHRSLRLDGEAEVSPFEILLDLGFEVDPVESGKVENEAMGRKDREPLIFKGAEIHHRIAEEFLPCKRNLLLH